MYAKGYDLVMPPMVSPLTPMATPYANEAYTGSAPSSATYDLAQRAAYYPVYLPTTYVVRRVWWANGATVSGGATVEVGVYDSDGRQPARRLVSGSATQSGATSLQFVDVTDTVLPPGLYWLALLPSTATNTTFFRTSLLIEYDAAVRMQENGLASLPSTATPAESSGASLWLFGITDLSA